MLANSLTLSYHPALPQIFKMGPVGAQLARYVLSQSFLNAAPLEEILDKIGAPTGGARGRAVAELRSGVDATCLEELGIKVSEQGFRRRVVVHYRAGATGKTLAIAQNLEDGRPAGRRPAGVARNLAMVPSRPA